MTDIATYYRLAFDIETSDYKLSWLNGDPQYKNDFDLEYTQNQMLKKDFVEIQNHLLNATGDAEDIKSGYAHILNAILNSFAEIEKWNDYYPDLSQGMIIPGYLFGLILSDLKTNLTSEGSYHPIPHIYMSKTVWPSADLKNTIIQIIQDLNGIKFNCKMDAIKFYENRILKQLQTQIRILQELRII